MPSAGRETILERFLPVRMEAFPEDAKIMLPLLAERKAIILTILF